MVQHSDVDDEIKEEDSKIVCNNSDDYDRNVSTDSVYACILHTLSLMAIGRDMYKVAMPPCAGQKC